MSTVFNLEQGEVSVTHSKDTVGSLEDQIALLSERDLIINIDPRVQEIEGRLIGDP